MNKLNEAWGLFTQKCSGWFTNRMLTLVGSIVASIIMLKLTWVGGLTEGYFNSYLLWVVGHATAAKFLDRTPNREAAKQEAQ